MNVHSIFSPRRQRILWVTVSLLLQLGLLVVIILRFNRYFVTFYSLCVVVSAGVSLFISTRRSKLAYKVAWVVPILIFPLFGGLMYLFLGGGRRPRGPTKEEMREIVRRELPRDIPREAESFGPDVLQMVRYLQNAALCPAYTGTETRYFSSGEAWYPVFLEELRSARRYLFLEYFLVAEGSLWEEVLEILVRKAVEGVEVYLLYDGVGSAATLPLHYDRRLEELGIHCRVFRPFRPVLSIHQNNRDHRKLCVIDGVTGFVGGLNLADEYVGRRERFGYWRDNALLLRGQAVWSLAVSFLSMWETAGNREPVDYPPFRPTLCPKGEGTGIVVPYTDTPLWEDTVSADLILMMVTKAKDHLYLTTPYLILDETLTAALCTAARSGVDVRILTPHIPDKKRVFAVTRSQYPGLLAAGVRVFEFLPGFTHTKTVAADGLYASVGSCNLDYRSLYLQYENGVFLCGSPTVEAVEEDFLAAAARSQEITPEDCRRSLPYRLLCAIFRLFSPLF